MYWTEKKQFEKSSGLGCKAPEHCIYPKIKGKENLSSRTSLDLEHVKYRYLDPGSQI